MDFLAHHILSVVLFTPLLGALVLLFIPREMENAHKIAGNVFGALGFLVSLPLLRWWNPGEKPFSFEESAEWIPSIGGSISSGHRRHQPLACHAHHVSRDDRHSLVVERDHQRTKEYYILLLLLQTGMIAFSFPWIFSFYVFWEVMLVPMYFLIGVLGKRPAPLRSHQVFFCTRWPDRWSCCWRSWRCTSTRLCLLAGRAPSMFRRCWPPPTTFPIH